MTIVALKTGSMRRMILIAQLAATYIGTVIGAGFASGQSIMQFFSVNGIYGTIGIIISMVLFMWIGTKMMVLARRTGAYSYQELNAYLFGRSLARLANLLSLIILLGITSVMLSSFGAIFKEQLGLPEQLGVGLAMLLCCLVLLGQLRGIILINSLVLPFMLLFTVILFINLPGLDDLLQHHSGIGHSVQNVHWIISPFIYAGLNFATLHAVLVPLGSEAEDDRVLIWAGLLGGLLLGLMLLISHYSIYSMMPGILAYDIPLAEVIHQFGQPVHLLFMFVIISEIFTTLVGNVFGMTRQLQRSIKWPSYLLVGAILLFCYIISLFGFTLLLTYLYPVFGYLGLILLLVIAIKKIPAK